MRLLPACARAATGAGVLVLSLAPASFTWAQATGPVGGAGDSTTQRPGRFRLGPFYLNPYFRISSVGLDTNVFYTAEERQTDASAVGGPGLDITLPIKEASRFYVGGGLDYLFFLRTESQRRLMGRAASGLDVKGQRTRFALEESYSTTYGRPTFEVDRRIEQVSEQTRAELTRRLFWRVGLILGGSRARHETKESEVYLGADLRKAVSRDEYRARAGLSYALTVKSSFVIEAEKQWSRFLEETSRDAIWYYLAAGFRTDATALISGETLVGLRYYRPHLASAARAQTTYASVGATWNVSAKTHFPFRYRRDLTYSFLSPAKTPTVLSEEAQLGIDKRLLARVDFRLFARRTRLRSDGEITLDIPGAGPVTSLRDDVAWDYGAEIAYLFRPNLRIGVAATYTDRTSTISYFSIEGLIVGATVQYSP